jgi:hypothetical protein
MPQKVSPKELINSIVPVCCTLILHNGMLPVAGRWMSPFLHRRDCEENVAHHTLISPEILNLQ